MEKIKIKNFAINARKKLRESVEFRLLQLGIDKNGVSKELDISTPDVKFYKNENNPLKGREIEWRQQIVERLKPTNDEKWVDTLDQFIEEVAYTWFNRIIAIRFMEVNDYLPSRVRVLSSEEGNVEPDIIKNVWDVEEDLGGYNNDERQVILKALDSKQAKEMDNLYAMLFIKQVDALSEILPGLFEKTSDYLKLLFVPNYNTGVIKDLVTEIPESYFDVNKEGQVEIIGWLYQYYNTEPHEKVVNMLGGPVKKRDIPAATQLFTTDWVVRYMVDNSIGKYYLERHPDSNLANSLKYLLPSKIKAVSDNRSITEYKLIDNAMGSGHILVYAFDVFMQIYEEEGYSKREAARLILKNNLYGLEIDQRAFQLAYFALIMKARQYDRRLFRQDITLNIYQFKDLKDVPDDFYQKIDTESAEILKKTINDFYNAQELGSIINLDKNVNIDALIAKVTSVDTNDETNLFNQDDIKKQILEILQIVKIMTQKYEAVVTNPPYMNKFEPPLKKYLQKNYKAYSKDLFSVFIYKNMHMLVNGGYAGYMIPLVWMFIKSYEALRKNIINTKKIDSLIQMEYSAFEEATVPINTFVIKNTQKDKIGTYLRLADFKGGMEVQKEKVVEAIANPQVTYLYRTNQTNFQKISGSPIAYWASENLIKDFVKGEKLGNILDTKVGLQTGNNKRFIRQWFEVSINNISFNSHSIEESVESGKKWFPYNKGGSYCKWYGNYDYVVNWKNDGHEIRNFKWPNGKKRSVVRNPDYYFKPAITWSDVNSGKFSLRYRKSGSIHDVKGMSAFANSNDLFKYMGVLNSKVGNYIFKIINPTISLQVGNFQIFPYLDIQNNKFSVSDNENLIKESIRLSVNDWNSFETSWDFVRHPLLTHITEHEQNWTLKAAYQTWEQEALKQFNQLKTNEEELNRAFINLYGLQNELTPEEDDKDVTVRKADQKRDVKSFLSYFIGCVFGRYSLNVDGLAYAGGNWDTSKYQTFKPNQNNLILLTDRDYFGDERDIINRLREFLKVTFGKEHLTENLHFIAETLAPNKVEKHIADEDIIRDYFISDFYKDHDKIYQKRPIYWEFKSGRNDGFKALMYLHRYDKNELSIARKYLHQLQAAYTNMISLDEQQMNHATSARDKNQYRKDTEKLRKMLDEIEKYDLKLQHQALAEIDIDLDDGVLANHAKVQGNEKLFSKI